jgi:hypothetical protein
MLDDKELEERKALVKKSLHSLTNCQQAVWGYFDLGEYRKAYVMCLECRSEYATLAALLAQIDAANEP